MRVRLLQEQIDFHTSFILSQINFERGHITIHIQGGKKSDRPRGAFILYTLARLLKSSHAPEMLKLRRDDVVSLLQKHCTESEPLLSARDMLYVQLYGIRSCELLGISSQPFVESFLRSQYTDLFVYPVTTYVFVSTCYESQTFAHIPFVKSLLHAALDTFDYLLHTNKGATYNAFHYAELSAWDGKAPAFITNAARGKIEQLFEKDLMSEQVYASGIAKCLEHFARVGDMHSFDRGVRFLEARRLDRFKNYMHPKLAPFAARVFTETQTSQYVSLDTSAHLIHAYLNLYEHS